MKRTNIVLDEKLVARAKAATGITVTRRLVDHALKEIVRRRDQRKLLELEGIGRWEGDLSAMRRGRARR